jgi:hypothetical protein
MERCRAPSLQLVDADKEDNSEQPYRPGRAYAIRGRVPARLLMSVIMALRALFVVPYTRRVSHGPAVHLGVGAG